MEQQDAERADGLEAGRGHTRRSWAFRAFRRGDRRSTRLAGIAALIGIGLIAGPAQAVFPGHNGKIAYRAGSNVILLTESGQLTFPGAGQYDFSPAFSPDGSRIAFIRQYSVSGGYFYQVLTVNADGTNLQLVANSGPFGPGGVVPFNGLASPAWNRDGERISFSVRAVTGAQAGIWTAGGEAGLVQTVQDVPPVKGSKWNLDWSPVTDEIVHNCSFRNDQFGLSKDDLCIDDEATGTTRQLPIDWPNAAPAGTIAEPKWTADGEKIVFTMGYSTIEGSIPHPVKRYDIFSINADGGGLTKLTDSGTDVCPEVSYPSFSNSVYLSPSPSPDGGSIVAYRTLYTRVGPPNICGLSQETGLYSVDGGVVVAVPNQVANTDWQPLPVDLLLAIDDGHGNPLKGLKVELRTPQGAVVDDQPINSAGGSYAFDSVTPGDYVIRAALVDGSGGPGATPAFEIQNGLAEPGPVWIQKPVTVTLGPPRLERIHFENSAGLAATSVDPDERERLDDMANIFFRVRQYVDWVKSHLTADTGAEVILYAYAEFSLDGPVFDPDKAAYFPSASSILMGTSFSEYSARDQASDQAPQNGEWHEFTHHLFASHIHSDQCMAIVGNHAGYANPDTCDSMDEGFASFLPTLAAHDIIHQTSSIYAGRWDLEDNTNAWAFRTRSLEAGSGFSKPVNGEDLAVAALLWDLVDSDADTKNAEAVGVDNLHHPTTYTDSANESLASLWTRMTSGDTAQTVYDLRASYGLPALTIDLDGDNTPDIAPIDEPFLMHGFFPIDTDQTIAGSHITYHYDVDYAQRPSSERDSAVGLSSHQAFTAAGIVTDAFIPREQIPTLPGANVAIDVLDASGTPLANAAVDLVVESGGPQSTSIQPLDGGSGALMYLELPAYFDYLLPVDAALPACDPATDIVATATLHVTLNGYASSETETTLDNCSYLQAIDADAGPAAASLTATFPEDSTPPISTLSASPTEPLVDGATPGVWKVGLSCSDPVDGGFASGCLRSEYRLDGGPVTPYRERVEVSGDGQHNFEYQSIDAASNEEGFRSALFLVPEPDPTLALLMGSLALSIVAGVRQRSEPKRPQWPSRAIPDRGLPGRNHRMVRKSEPDPGHNLSAIFVGDLHEEIAIRAGSGPRPPRPPRTGRFEWIGADREFGRRRPGPS